MRFGAALMASVVVEYTGWRLLGVSGSGLMVPLCQRLLWTARPGRRSSLRLPKAQEQRLQSSTSIDAQRLQQFWQMPWAVCFCTDGAAPQWLFRDEVSRAVFVQCCREAHLALSSNPARKPF